MDEMSQGTWRLGEEEIKKKAGGSSGNRALLVHFTVFYG
jgi:hypothetical protein